MGNGNSTFSKRTRGSEGAKVASTEPQYIVAEQRKHSTKAKLVCHEAYPATATATAEEHGMKPLCDDETFSNFIQRAKYKIRSMSKISPHEEHKQSYPEPVDEANGTNDKKENERDHFSDFIQNARKKIRTVSRRNSSFREE